MLHWPFGICSLLNLFLVQWLLHDLTLLPDMYFSSSRHTCPSLHTCYHRSLPSASCNIKTTSLKKNTYHWNKYCCKNNYFILCDFISSVSFAAYTLWEQDYRVCMHSLPSARTKPGSHQVLHQDGGWRWIRCRAMWKISLVGIFEMKLQQSRQSYSTDSNNQEQFLLS